MSRRKKIILGVALGAVVAAALFFFALARPSPAARAAAERWRRLKERRHHVHPTPSSQSADLAPIDPSTSPVVRVSAENYVAAWHEAVCRRWSRCGVQSRDIEVCMAALTAAEPPGTVGDQDEREGVGLLRAVQRHELDYDPAVATRVLRTYATGPCQTKLPDAGSSFTGKRQVGESCSHYRSCASGLECDGLDRWNSFNRFVPTSGPGVCNPLPADHASPLPANAQPCRDGNCADDLHCDDGTCRPDLHADDRCDPAAPAPAGCGHATRCWPDGRCRAPADIDEPCYLVHRNSGGHILGGATCRHGLACIAVAPGAPEGVCSLLRDEGEPCRDDRDCRTERCGTGELAGICVDQYWHPWVPPMVRRVAERIDDLWYSLR